MLLAMAVVVLEVLALVFEGIERLIFNLPPCAPSPHEVQDVAFVHPQVRHPTEVLDLIIAHFPVLNEMHPHIRVRCIERDVADKAKAMHEPRSAIVPLNASRADERINVIEYWEIGQNQVQHFSWVTDLRVRKRNVYKLMRGGRARWNIENETFNTLKNQGYNFEHNYGHGEQHLSVVFATLMMVAFLVDQTQQLCCALFQAVWAKLGSKRLLWERMRALFYDYAFASMCQLFEALLYGFKKSSPIVAIDSS